MTASNALPDSKPRYEILDGLRGVAAVLVVLFHICEAHAASPLSQWINHGYLAVDFFFLLSGYVIGYAYDDRWAVMGQRGFFLRRLIRLHPMVILGSVVGAVAFYFARGETFPLIAQTSTTHMLIVMLVGCTMIPLWPAADIRGWQETYPLNGPAWSLFFEYVGNLIYALVVRHFSLWLMAALVFVCASVTIHYGVTNPQGNFAGGWSLDPTQLRIGFTRLAFPFFAGLLLFRLGHIRPIRHAFWWCSLLLLVAFALPRWGGEKHFWINGLYEALCIILLFPLVIFLGAGGKLTDPWSAKICDLMGRLSYPLYITHYALIYIYTAWIARTKLSLAQAWPQALLVFLGSLTLAYLYLRCYDEPVRRWLQARWLAKKSVG